MSTPQRPTQFTIFSNTTPHKHSSPLRRITARVKAHFDSSTESDITRRPRSHTQPEQYRRPRVFSEGPSSSSPVRAEHIATYPRGFRRAGGSHPSVLARPSGYLAHAPRLYEAGPHDLWMGGRVPPRQGLRTPKPLAAVGRGRYPKASRHGRPQPVIPTGPLNHASSMESMSDVHIPGARIGHSVSATSSFVLLDSFEAPLSATALDLGNLSPRQLTRFTPESIQRARGLTEADSEWMVLNGRRHLRTQLWRGVKQERRERKEVEASGSIGTLSRGIAYPEDYSPDTLACHALGYLLNSGPDPPHLDNKQPEQCLDLGCGGGEWIRGALSRWPNCKFTGMDVVFIHRAQTAGVRKQQGSAPGGAADAKRSRVTWVKGDFLDGPLPFVPSSFDYVHLRNIARAVPHHAWLGLMTEVGRVLKPGGIVDVTAEDIIFPILPRSLTARPNTAQVAAHMDGLFGRRADDPTRVSEDTVRVSEARGVSGETVRTGRAGQTVRGVHPPSSYVDLTERGEWGEGVVVGGLPQERASEGTVRRGASTTPSETISGSRERSDSKPRSRSRDMLRGAFSDGEGVRAGFRQILRGSRRSGVLSPPRSAGSGAETVTRKSAQSAYVAPTVPTATLQESSGVIAAAFTMPTVCDVIHPSATIPGVRVSMEDTRPFASSQAALGLGVPSFGMALSSVALGSALSLRSMDGSIINSGGLQGSFVSLHPPPACSSLALGHSSVISFQGPLSPPLTPPRKELLVPDLSGSDSGSEARDEVQPEPAPVTIRPSLGHDFELLEELFYAVYARRGIHLQPTTILGDLIQSTGAFASVYTNELVTASMPVRPSVKLGGADSPPTPDMSPKSGNAMLSDDMGSRNALSLKCALQGVLSVREPMWEELVLRRDLGESPDERVRYERTQFEEMLASYTEAIKAIIDVPTSLVSICGWSRPVPREPTPELKWIKVESQRLRAEWAAREAIHGLAGYSAFSARTRSYVCVKADASDD
ncbi:hypothetical protein BDV93DRAFT_517498 [Ceratobasidium sp. AG-I]|nr:hypothetical protein BDV93DRAFT_517498 [Ceratobasidium sp. AG-I]